MKRGFEDRESDAPGLNVLSDEEHEQLWIREAEERVARYEAGETVAIDSDEVFARARARNAPR